MITIPLTQGQVALIDDEDAHLASLRWHLKIGPTGVLYARRHSSRSEGHGTIYLHREVLGSPSEEVDHINGNGLDCRRSNLRLAARHENARNQKLSRASTSGLKGVIWHIAKRRWQARIGIDGRRVHLGYFDSALAAARAYDRAAMDLHGRFARLNFPAHAA